MDAFDLIAVNRPISIIKLSNSRTSGLILAVCWVHH